MQVQLIDGTYELFRFYFAMPERLNTQGENIAAVRGVLGSLFSMIEEGATHISVATDSVIESWRNAELASYKDGSQIAPELAAQFPVLEDALRAAGFSVMPMLEYEADDALAAAAAVAYEDQRVQRVFICTPDKDLAQCVTEDGKVVQFDRRKRQLIDHQGVIDKFGVQPKSIPDYLALVGDSADGIPGLQGWGAKSTAAVLSHYHHIENIPEAVGQWELTVRGGANLSKRLNENMQDVLLYRRLTTVSRNGPQVGDVDSMCYRGPQANWHEMCDRLDAPAWKSRG